MTSYKYLKVVMCCLLLSAMSLYCRSALSQQNYDAGSSGITGIGREDPFAKLAIKQTPGVTTNETPEIIVPGDPELFFETVRLKSINVKSLRTAIESMSSEFGSVAIDNKNNSIIICDTKEKLTKILSELEKIDKTQHQIMFVETIPLKFLDAKNLKVVLDSMSSGYGRIATDENTNSLIVCDTKHNLERIIAEIKKADQTPKQIIVEVFILDVKLDDKSEVGVNWSQLFETKRKQQYTQSLIETFAGSAVGTATSGADFTYIHTDISGAIHALQEVRNVEILASPRVLVLSGKSAQIKTVEEIPYKEVRDTSQGGSSALTSTQFKEIGVILEVKATVLDDNKILLTVQSEQSVNTGEFGIEDVPIVDTRNATTSLLMEDGQVVAIGGLRREETKISTDQVPLLGDLPLLGFLFRNKTNTVNHSELLILISPHIHRESQIDVKAMKKFEEIKNKSLLSLPKNKKYTDEDLLSILMPNN